MADGARPSFRDALAGAEPVKTAKNSHIVWQLIYQGWALQGPPEQFRDGWIPGRIGWKTKRDAAAALVELRALVAAT